MQLTDYRAKYFAHELTKRCPSDSAEKLAGALVNAQADLNPHQIEAAFKSPLSRGAMLADEVGLGKTFGISGYVARLIESLPKKLEGLLPSPEEIEAELSRK